MEERLYQMRDLMERFGVTRDTVKYYEKKGLLVPKRTDNRYRTYTEADVQKLKMILDYRNMGFSLEQIAAQEPDQSFESRIEEIRKIKEDISGKIEELQTSLKKLDAYEKMLRADESRETDVEHACCICFFCKNKAYQYGKDAFVRDVKVIHFSDEYQIQNVEERVGILPNSRLKVERDCSKCPKSEMLFIPKAYYKVWLDDGEQTMEAFFGQIYKEAESQGYVLKKTAYCTKHLGKANGEICICYRIYIPIEN